MFIQFSNKKYPFCSKSYYVLEPLKNMYNSTCLLIIISSRLPQNNFTISNMIIFLVNQCNVIVKVFFAKVSLLDTFGLITVGGIYETLYVCIFTLHKANYSDLSTALVTQNDYRFSVVYVDLATSYLIISHKFSQTAGKILKIMIKTSVQYFDRYIYCNK